MYWLRAFVWMVLSAGVLLAGFAVFGASILIPSVIAKGTPDQMQRMALGAVYSAIAAQALLPELGITAVVWLALASAFPALDRSWRSLLLGVPLVAAIAFPVIGKYSFTIWEAGSAQNYAATLVLLAFGVSAALLVPRALSQALAPGCFTIAPGRGMVNAR
jgi:hypothetical protein